MPDETSKDIMKSFSRAAIVAVPMLLASAPVFAQSGGMPSTLAGDFEVRIQQLERQLSEMTGRYEEAGHEIRALRDRLERMSADVDDRLAALEGGGRRGAGGGGASSAAQSPPPATTARRDAPPPRSQDGETLGTTSSRGGNGGGAVNPPSDPQRAYEQAYGYLREADYDRAEKAFLAFMKSNPRHSLAANAQYWLGETYYVRGKYADAAGAFAEGMRSYPKGNKAPDNLLKLGMALAQTSKTKEACAAYAQLPKLYPDSSAAVKRRAQSEARKLNCAG